MSQWNEFTIDLEETFPHLSRPPIVEAVIHWQTAVGKMLDKSQVNDELTKRFPNYDCRQQQVSLAEFKGSPDGVEMSASAKWDGFRLNGKDDAEHNVVQLKPNGVVFSRVKHYDCWETLEAEALRFWEVFVDLAEPPVIERLGVRFINQVELANSTGSYFLKGIPSLPQGMELSRDSFFHQDTLQVSGYPYQINWIRAVQRTLENERVLIVDIDVSTSQVESVEREAIKKCLAEMRILKNKLFFSCAKDSALKHFGRE
ncbi:MAG: TIGR04255 family protein [Planctomycetia bacterium]|nr:TIGR04255 family protein [Planctomycetia bacterium]